MRARVATFEGETGGSEHDEQIEQIRSEWSRPPGLEDAKGVLVLSGEGGKRLAITFFEARRGCGAETPRSTR